MSPPRVSVLIPVYNGSAYLAKAISSALSQTFSDYEIIVINDGSSDNSAAIADGFARQCSQNKIKVIHQPNSGLCASRNAGILAAQGEFIALLDADDIWLPQHLAESIAVFDRKATVGLAHANIQAIGHDDSFLRDVSLTRWPNSATDPWREIFLRNEHISCPTTVFRRDLAMKLGNFDMAFNRLGCEDRDLWLRLLSVADVAYINSVHALYRLHQNNMSKQFEKMLKARLQLIEKHSQSERGQKLKRLALSATYTDMGLELRADNRHRTALKLLTKALMYSPLNRRIWRATLGALIARR